jgi:hypothetical protein
MVRVIIIGTRGGEVPLPTLEAGRAGAGARTRRGKWGAGAFAAVSRAEGGWRRARARAEGRVGELDFERCAVELAAVHVGRGRSGGRRVCVFERGFSFVLTGCGGEERRK